MIRRNDGTGRILLAIGLCGLVALHGTAGWGLAAPGATPPPAAESRCRELEGLEAAVRAAPESLHRASAYRHAAIACATHDRAIAFFEQLVAAHPRSPSALLNFGYAYVDKIPSVGAVTQVILANRALEQFARAVELAPSWLALYTRGNSLLYWPKVFGRTPQAVADLERAVALSREQPVQGYQVRAWVALGDAYWKLDQLERARASWHEGRERFPDDPRLAARLAAEGEALRALIEADLDPGKRVDTDLSVLPEGG